MSVPPVTLWDVAWEHSSLTILLGEEKHHAPPASNCGHVGCPAQQAFTVLALAAPDNTSDSAASPRASRPPRALLGTADLPRAAGGSQRPVGPECPASSSPASTSAQPHALAHRRSRRGCCNTAPRSRDVG